jgi:hypothetical protein
LKLVSSSYSPSFKLVISFVKLIFKKIIVGCRTSCKSIQKHIYECLKQNRNLSNVISIYAEVYHYETPNEHYKETNSDVKLTIMHELQSEK